MVGITTLPKVRQMQKPNYQFEKRQRELEKKKKKAEKALRKSAETRSTTEASSEVRVEQTDSNA